MKNNSPFVSNNRPYIFELFAYFLLKNKLYIPAIAIFPISVLINPINNKMIDNIGFVVIPAAPVCVIALENNPPTNVVIINKTAVIAPPNPNHNHILPTICRPEILLGSFASFAVDQFWSNGWIFGIVPNGAKSSMLIVIEIRGKLCFFTS